MVKRVLIILAIVAIIIAIGFTVADIFMPEEPHFDQVSIRMDDGSIVRGYVQFMEDPDEEGMVRVSIDDIVYRVPVESITIITR